MPLEAHPQQIGRFVAALFRYAEEGSFVSLRAFDQFDRGRSALFVEGVPVSVDGNLDRVVSKAVELSTRAAAGHPAVFAPPIATFNQQRQARTIDLKNGLAISVDLDSGDTREARKRLEAVLGSCTIAVRSGGEWIDDRTGEVHAKMHLHWRLSEPTTTPAEHQQLQDARWLAAVLVGVDRSAAPSAHPLRWPGSWNLKSKPRLAEIIAEHPDAEVHLGEAFAALQEAVEAAGLGGGTSGATKASAAPQARPEIVAQALAAVPNLDVSWDEWVRIGMAAWNATGGSGEGEEAWTAWSAKSAKHDPAACRERWAHFAGSPPNKIGAGTIFFLARCAGWQDPRRRAEPSSNEPPPADPDDPGYQPDEHYQPRPRRTEGGEIIWPVPVNFMAEESYGAPLLAERHIPAVLWPFVKDVAERMGVDPTGVALAALVCLASVIHEKWRVQPKRLDYSYTEAARLWGAILGPPSTIKTAQISECSRPLDELEVKARKQHQEEMQGYEAALAEHKRALKAKEPTEEPRMPKLKRHMVEDATIEAVSEVLRDHDDAKGRQFAPCGKVLIRQDELSSWFASMERYKSGNSSDRGAYLKMYNGQRQTFDRVMRGSFAVNSWSGCILGGCQPGPIQKIARETDDDGLLQRFIWCVPAGPRIGIDRAPDREAIARYRALFPALVALEPARDPGSDRISPVVLHRDAHAIREEVEAVARGMMALPDMSRRIQSAFGKWGAIFMRVVLTFHMVEIAAARSQGVIGTPIAVIPAEVVQQAADFMIEIVLPHQMRAEAMMFSTVQGGHAQWIAGHILAKGHTRVTRTDVTRAYSQLRAPEAAQELAAVMTNLVNVGWLEPEEPTNIAKGTHAWLVNPQVHTLFAERAARERADRAATQEQAARDFETLMKKRRAKEAQA